METLEGEMPAMAAKQSRKPSIWTKEKISQLIALYKKHNCLWDTYTDSYKSKERRTEAVESICRELHISKFEIGKKIHNLRNQFNSEMKKLERRLEVAGEHTTENNHSQHCRWEHFESLMFLKHIIQPRPGGALQYGYPPPKKMRLKCDYGDESEQIAAPTRSLTSTSGNSMCMDGATDYHTEDTTPDQERGTNDDFSAFEEEPALAERDSSHDQKYCISTTQGQNITSTTLASTPQSPVVGTTHQAKIPLFQSKPNLQQPITQVDEPAGEITSLNPLTAQQPRQNITSDDKLLANHRDQWDSFGELIATEFRNLNSDLSRKKLKRKIMQAMLEVGEEDDEICARSKTS